MKLQDWNKKYIFYHCWFWGISALKSFMLHPPWLSDLHSDLLALRCHLQSRIWRKCRRGSASSRCRIGIVLKTRVRTRQSHQISANEPTLRTEIRCVAAPPLLLLFSFVLSFTDSRSYCSKPELEDLITMLNMRSKVTCSGFYAVILPESVHLNHCVTVKFSLFQLAEGEEMQGCTPDFLFFCSTALPLACNTSQPLSKVQCVRLKE